MSHPLASVLEAVEVGTRLRAEVLEEALVVFQVSSQDVAVRIPRVEVVVAEAVPLEVHLLLLPWVLNVLIRMKSFVG